MGYYDTYVNVRFGDARVKLIASDVGKFEREAWVENVVIAPAERYVVDVRFESASRVGITNTIQAVNHFRGEFYPHEDTLSVVTVSGSSLDDEVTEAFPTLRQNLGRSRGYRTIPGPARQACGLRVGDHGAGA